MNEQQYNVACYRIYTLMNAKNGLLAPNELDEVRELLRQVDEYEEKHFPIAKEK